MKRLVLACVVAIVVAPMAVGQVAGDWEGTLDVTVAKLRVVIHLTNEKDAWSGTLDSPDQGGFGIPIGTISFKDSVLKFDVPSIAGTYEGATKDANTLTGEWKQGGRTFPLTFTRQLTTLTTPEREFLIGHLRRTAKLFRDSIAGLTDEQWKFKPGPDRWSIAECAEHIAVSEEQLLSLAQKVAQSPVPGPRLKNPAELDLKIMTAMTDRSQKGKAPEMLKPTGRFPDRAAVEAAFADRRSKTLKYAESTQDDLRAHYVPHSVFKTADAYQWLLVLSSHSERHTAQINEVKADPQFPKKPEPAK